MVSHFSMLHINNVLGAEWEIWFRMYDWIKLGQITATAFGEAHCRLKVFLFTKAVNGLSYYRVYRVDDKRRTIGDPYLVNSCDYTGPDGQKYNACFDYEYNGYQTWYFNIH